MSNKTKVKVLKTTNSVLTIVAMFVSIAAPILTLAPSIAKAAGPDIASVSYNEATYTITVEIEDMKKDTNYYLKSKIVTTRQVTFVSKRIFKQCQYVRKNKFVLDKEINVLY